MEMRGIIVHSTPFDESSRVVELLTAAEGKLGCVARGARASKKRFSGGLDIFSTVSVEVQPSTSASGLWRLDSAGVVAARLGIRKSLEAFERAGRLTEGARSLANPHQRADEQLAALEYGLDACDRGELRSAIAAYPRLLAAAGIMPDDDALACAPEIAAAFLSGDAPNMTIADAVESIALAWVEDHIGRPLRTRVTPVTGGGS
jgi:recombinational DNA repair protein (RecF pathway)